MAVSLSNHCVFRTIGCASISRTSYFRHQKTFLNPAIFQIWDMNQQSYFAQLAQEGKPLVLGGDGRADSPGHFAKFGSYSLVELNHNIVLDICLVQSNEVSSSNHMELEGLKRAVAKIHNNNMVIQSLITKRHQQIIKWLRDMHPTIEHFYDVWHSERCQEETQGSS
uniref:Uncharacterized protein n=1 Tax=Amphimedon queenslandica TaxID=400682 RepID=A0A1X7UA90_AMPQE